MRGDLFTCSPLSTYGLPRGVLGRRRGSLDFNARPGGPTRKKWQKANFFFIKWQCRAQRTPDLSLQVPFRSCQGHLGAISPYSANGESLGFSMRKSVLRCAMASRNEFRPALTPHRSRKDNQGASWRGMTLINREKQPRVTGVMMGSY